MAKILATIILNKVRQCMNTGNDRPLAFMAAHFELQRTFFSELGLGRCLDRYKRFLYYLSRGLFLASKDQTQHAANTNYIRSQQFNGNSRIAQ